MTTKTLLVHEDRSAFGISSRDPTDIHVVFFQPIDDVDGPRNVVCLEIPETRKGLANALKVAIALRARVVFVCDTGEQANTVAIEAALLLPRHRRVDYDRARAGDWTVQ